MSWMPKAGAIGRRQRMQWKDLTGEERFRVVEMARKGTKSMTELCETFGVTRQTLTRAIATAEEAMKAALEPKKPGRKGKSEEEQKITQLSKQASSLEKDVEHWKTRYEVAQAYIDIVHEQEEREMRSERNRRKRDRKKQKKKKPRKATGAAGKSSGTSKPDSGNAGGSRLAVIDGGADAGDSDTKPEEMEEKA